MLDRLIVAASFLLIFAFSSVDSAVSPMVEVLHSHFAVPMSQVLWLISWCTLGTVTGVFLGPALTARFKVSRLLTFAVIGLVVALGLFLSATDFRVALLARLFFGLSSGTVAACMWWLTFYGVSKQYYPAMVAVLMSARPLATAIGVPLVGLVAAKTVWQTPLAGFGFVLMLGGGGLVSALLVKNQPQESSTKPFLLGSIFNDYIDAFRVPYASSYYIGFAVNRMCYFGFYAFSGIWFIRHYGLTLVQISSALFVIGIAEALVNFTVPGMIKRFGHAALFKLSLVASAVLLPSFIFGKLPLALAVAFITVFMLLDRVYSMALIVMMPNLFKKAQNMTVFGSLNTLTAWAGLTVISWFEGKFLDVVGLATVETVLLVCFLSGSVLIYRVQKASNCVPS